MGRSRAIRLFGVVGIVALVGAACSTTEEATEPEPSVLGEVIEAPDAMVRVAHWSPDAPEVDVYVDGAAVLTDVPFGVVSGYLDLAPGTYTFAVRPAGADASSTPVIEADATVDGEVAYTVAAVGALADIRPAIFIDDLSDPAAGNAHVRAVHAIPDVGPVDINVRGVGTVVEDLAFGEATPYLPVPDGEYTFRVRAAGTNDTLLRLTATLPAGTISTATAIGSAGEGTARVEAYADAG